MRTVGLTCALLGGAGLHVADACTTMAAGKKATAQGTVLIAHADDGDPRHDGRLLHVPAMDHAEGAMRPVYNSDGNYPRVVSYDRGPDYRPPKEKRKRRTGKRHKHEGNEDEEENEDEDTHDEEEPMEEEGRQASDEEEGSESSDEREGGARAVSTPIGYVPQAGHTYAYHDTGYAVMNEHNVAIAESTCSSMFRTCAKGSNVGCEPGRTIGDALFNIETLSELALERTRTARDAVQLMGDLAEAHGFYGTQDPNGYGEALQVADANEVWTFNILADDTGRSAIWAAARLPDDHVTVLANMFTVRDVNVSDPATSLASKNVYSIAKSYGWWKPGKPLDFTAVYSNGEYGAQYYAGRRMWRVLSLAAPSLNLPATYTDLKYDRMWPYSVKPDRPVTREDFMSWYRDWYAGTPYDMTKGLAAGPGGTPDRFDLTGNVRGHWERSIALFRTNAAFINEMRQEDGNTSREEAGVVWFAAGPAHYCPYLPLPSGVDKSLEPLMMVDPDRFLSKSMNWACRKVMMACQVRFDHMHPMVEEKQKEVEAEGQQVLAEAVAAFRRNGNKKRFYRAFARHAKRVLKLWHKLPDEMLFRFSDNADILASAEAGKNVFLGYPSSWLQGVGLPQGPPAPPPIRPGRCPPWDTACQATELLTAVGVAGTINWTVVTVCAVLVLAGTTLVFQATRRARSSPKPVDSTPYTSLF